MNWRDKIHELEREARKKGITQSMISERTGIHQPHISRFFKAGTCPRLDTYLNIYDAIINYTKITIMETKKLKKLAKEFSDFLVDSGSTDIDGVMGEFWFAKFGVSNEEREKELLTFWKTIK